MPHNLPVSRRRFFLSGITQISRQNSASHNSLGINGSNNATIQQIFRIPPVHPDYWSLTISGTEAPPLILSYTDTFALPAIDIQTPLICRGNGVPRTNLTIWRGVSFWTLLERLNIGKRFARFVASDGYVTSLPVNLLHDAVLVHTMNERPLSHEHGFPIRLLVPGTYGYKMPKWLTRIELTDTEPIGFWEARGWSRNGMIETRAEIVRPHNRESVYGSLTICGIAYTGIGSIRQIEVNIDDGPWMPVAFNPVPRHHGIEWSIQWVPPVVGDYLIKARAYNGSQWNDPSTSQGILVHVVEL